NADLADQRGSISENPPNPRSSAFYWTVTPILLFPFRTIFSPTRLGRALLHITQTLARDRFRIGCIIEDLHRHPAVVAAVLQGAEDRYEVGGPEAGAAAVGVVRMEVSGAGRVTADQVGDRRAFRRHGLHVQVQHEVRVFDG